MRLLKEVVQIRLDRLVQAMTMTHDHSGETLGKGPPEVHEGSWMDPVEIVK